MPGARLRCVVVLLALALLASGCTSDDTDGSSTTSSSRGPVVIGGGPVVKGPNGTQLELAAGAPDSSPVTMTAGSAPGDDGDIANAHVLAASVDIDYPDPLGPEYTATCEGDAARNGFFGEGVVNALRAVTTGR